ncbi:MAG: hypothetical protein HZA54_03675 [Planctomycetes bacterium]|nr:hypothetical protein [Planctomycetota bacterium]
MTPRRRRGPRFGLRALLAGVLLLGGVQVAVSRRSVPASETYLCRKCGSIRVCTDLRLLGLFSIGTSERIDPSWFSKLLVACSQYRCAGHAWALVERTAPGGIVSPGPAKGTGIAMRRIWGTGGSEYLVHCASESGDDVRRFVALLLDPGASAPTWPTNAPHGPVEYAELLAQHLCRPLPSHPPCDRRTCFQRIFDRPGFRCVIPTRDLFAADWETLRTAIVVPVP